MQIVILIYCIMVANVLKLAVFATFYFRSFLLYFPFLGVFCFFQHFILGVS